MPKRRTSRSSTASTSPFVAYTRRQWSRLRANTPLTLDRNDLEAIRGVNDRISLREVSDIYLPLSRLLSLHVAGVQDLHRATATFLGRRTPKVPYIIGIGGSVAVGKSTSARLLQTLLARWPDHPRVELVTTDGFLYPNRTLERRGLMRRKGFPESYDQRRLLDFLSAVKSGEPEVHAPLYSHLVYDILPDQVSTVHQPDILILEGLNVLQPAGIGTSSPGGSFVSDYFDFSIYIDAAEPLIRQWFIDRFQTLRHTAFRDPTSFFHRYATLSTREALRFAQEVWREINGKNLRENILPTCSRADLILTKGKDHAVHRVLLRRL